MVILSAVAIGSIKDNGIVSKTQEASFLTEMRNYQEETELIVSKNTMERYIDSVEAETINVGLEGQPNIDTVLNVSNRLRDQVIIQDNILYYKYNETRESAKRVKLCVQANIPVWDYENLDLDMLE